jgi:glucose-6-phosphate 1-dehydrogenase
MTEEKADAFVFFGATGDLAYKQIFPALLALVRDGELDMPVIGVAKSGWNLDQLKARARESVEKHGPVDERLLRSWPAACSTWTATMPTRRRLPN